MISPKAFTLLLAKSGINFFFGVPDSLLKNFCAYITDTAKPHAHIIAANEGNAIALAAGHYLATGKVGLVYLQNSGLGNSVNPLVSLADSEVYGIPILLLVGWRGEPGIKDEPQHTKQGKITRELLKTMGVAYEVLPASLAGAKKAVAKAVIHMRASGCPYALIIKNATFAPYTLKKITPQPRVAHLLREEAIEIITNQFNGDEVLVATTGKTSRELFELRESAGSGHERDFLTVGSMGHSSQIALGVALAKPDRQVYCLDGDGALIMHMGALATTGNASPNNFKHIVLNNGAHESVGGQPTAALSIDIPAIAQACGYKKTFQASDERGLRRSMDGLKKSTGPALLEVLIRQGSRQDLGRPTVSPKENKKAFMDFLSRGLQAFSAPVRLKKFFEKNKAQRIFLVTGSASYKKSGAEQMFRSVLSHYEVFTFSNFDINPKIEDVERGIKIFRKKKCDVTVAVGGGSTIDMAKLINTLSAQRSSPASYILGQKTISKQGKSMVAIPTTAGSGSEATRFAVVYIDGVKYSVEHDLVLPNLAIVEPELTMSMTPNLTAVSGMDALSQAIESYWSVNATPTSKRFSKKAISLILGNLAPSVKNPTRVSRAAMARGANLSGQAINLAKTTAPHALSYVLTSRFGIPHGHAVALTLGALFFYNSGVNRKDVADKRGETYIKNTFVELECLLGVSNSQAAVFKLESIMKKIGLETRLSKLGIRRSDINAIANGVNIKRLKNNPRRLDRQDIARILISLL